MTDQIIRVLMGHGALGLLAAVFIYLFIKEQAAHHAAREKLEKALKDQEATLRTQQEKHDEERAALQAQLAAERKERGEETRELLEQINDLRESHAERERASMQTVEYFARQGTEGIEELGRIADILRRAYDGRPKR